MIRRTPRASLSIGDHAIYLWDHSSPAVVDRFLESVETSLVLLESAPRIGRLINVRGHPKSRRWTVKGFPNHVLLYREVPEGIELLLLYHAAEDELRVLRELIDDL